MNSSLEHIVLILAILLLILDVVLLGIDQHRYHKKRSKEESSSLDHYFKTGKENNMETNRELVSEIFHELRNTNLNYNAIEYILENDRNEIHAMVVNDKTDERCYVMIDADKTVREMEVEEWSFNFDEDFLNRLEEGYQIRYMPTSTHYNIWCFLDDIRDDITHTDGLQLYLGYCQNHSIDSKTLQSLELLPVDISDLYKESNNCYEIISQMQCNDDVFVLGHRKGAAKRYVTWQTNVDRTDGYNNGHYFSSLSTAQRDLYQRFKQHSNKIYIEQILNSGSRSKKNDEYSR